MSRFTVRSSSRQQRTRTPFCKVCKKAGKPQSVYTSHFVRDKPNGKVVCPTLLSTECRYCHELGHTKAHCPKLAEKARRQASYEKQQKANLKKRKAEDRLRAQVEASQQEGGETFLTMNYLRARKPKARLKDDAHSDGMHLHVQSACTHAHMIPCDGGHA